jgi:hypothetical protein
MGQRLQIEWQETAEGLKGLYRKEKHPRRRTRLHTLWQLRTGKRVQEVAGIAGWGAG